tara:strand:+ start:659 stop:1621 length:963 start_codon:yes stop_codon:yes gene_type:complete
MAILRGGTRIFGQDIRIGLPRDKSLSVKEIKKTIKEGTTNGKFGGNPETTIGRFQGHMNQGEGLARPTRFKVRFGLPQSAKLGNFGFTAATGGPPNKAKAAGSISDLEMTRNVEMMCNKVTMPARDINSTAVQHYGPAREIPYAYSFNGQIGMNFYGDKFLRQRQFFEKWQSMIFDENSHHMNYYDSYIGVIDIYQLGSFSAENDRDRITYAVRLYECYPETVSGIEYDYGATDQGVQVPITFRYRNWINLLADDVQKATIGKLQGDVPEMKQAPASGLFGGLLSKLPPELQRAGRDVLNAGRRALPIGRVTGGKVFPPF